MADLDLTQRHSISYAHILQYAEEAAADWCVDPGDYNDADEYVDDNIEHLAEDIAKVFGMYEGDWRDGDQDISADARALAEMALRKSAGSGSEAAHGD